MKPQGNARSQGGFNIQDILYVLFKHKWKILALSLIGFAIAGGILLRSSRTPLYESNAKLLVRYVLERGAVDDFESRLDAGGKKGGGVMGTELEILTSLDLAEEVAEKVGPEKLLPESETPPSVGAAALKIINGLEVGTSRGSNVILVTYRNAKPELAIEVLNQLVESYFAMHLEIHRSSEGFDEVSEKTDKARSLLRDTESELNKLKGSSGILSVEESMTALETRRSSVRGAILVTEAELAQQRTHVAALEAALGVSSAEDLVDSEAPAEQPEKEAEPVDPAVSEKALADQRATAMALNDYRDLSQRLIGLKQRRNELLLTKTATNPLIESYDRQISDIEARGLALLEAHPELSATPTGPAGQGAPPGNDLNVERAKLAALIGKLQALKEQSEGLDQEVVKISDLALQINTLERRRAMDEEKYRYFETNLEKSRVDVALDPASMPNIGTIQKPSMPTKSLNATTMKLVAGISLAGVALGIGFAFLKEWVIDRRISRPTEIQTRLQLPLMLTIPYMRSKDGVSKLIGREPGLELLGDAGDVLLPPIPQNEGGEVSVNGSDHFITPYADAIRDRIMFNFEINNITHKPKLVGLTGLSSGAGTSTVAAGLAKSFAENGKWKVLLVDLNPAMRGGTFQRHPAESLLKALDVSKNERFRKSQRNLYFASAPTRREGAGSYALAPMALHEIMPHLAASDFDYIIFDMPPVDPTSPTLAMGGFMDKMLLVLDAEDTTKESLSWGYSELEKGRADVSCIFNKAKNHAPRWVQSTV